MMKKTSVAMFKRLVSGRKVKFIAVRIIATAKLADDLSRVETELSTPQKVEPTTVTFNTVDMLRELPDGRKSHLGLKGVNVYMNDAGFCVASPWDNNINMCVYQF